MVEFFSDLTDEEYRKILERARYERGRAMKDLFAKMTEVDAPSLKMKASDGGHTPQAAG